MTKVITIIATHNGMPWAERCFGSLSKSIISTEIIAIDNASQDGTPNFISANFPEVNLIRNQTNLGFGKANNIGLKIAIDLQADYVFLLNQDAWINPDTISGLIQSHVQNPEFGILSPVHLNASGTQLEAAFAYFVENDCNPEERSKIYSRSGEEDSLIEVDFINAAAWLLPIETVLKIGGFDPLFFYTGEDTDYVNRAKYHGLKTGVQPHAIIYHDSAGHTFLRNIQNSDWFKISRLADSYKVLKNINRSFLWCILKSYWLLTTDTLKSLNNKRIFFLYLSLWWIISNQLKNIWHNRAISRQSGPVFLDSDVIEP